MIHRTAIKANVRYGSIEQKEYGKVIGGMRKMTFIFGFIIILHKL